VFEIRLAFPYVKSRLTRLAIGVISTGEGLRGAASDAGIAAAAKDIHHFKVFLERGVCQHHRPPDARPVLRRDQQAVLTDPAEAGKARRDLMRY
jgi:hypothetical protein